MNKNISFGVIFISVFLTNPLKAEAPHTHSSSPVIPAFSAQYSISRSNDKIGKAERTLRYISPEVAEYSYHTDLQWLIFSDKRTEFSTVRIRDAKLIPQHYRFTRKGTGSDKAYDWTYDIKNSTATNIIKNKSKTINFPENIQDKLSYHLQNRLNLITAPETKHFDYPVIGTNGKIKNYEYDFDGEDDLMLPYGLVKTLRFKRVVEKKSKVTYAWFAPEHQYLLVKLRLEKEGVEQFEAELDSYTLTHKPYGN